MPTDDELAVRACIINIVLGSGVYGNSTTVNHLCSLINEPQSDLVTHCQELSNSHSWFQFDNPTISITDTQQAVEFAKEIRRNLYGL